MIIMIKTGLDISDVAPVVADKELSTLLALEDTMQRNKDNQTRFMALTND